MATRGRRARTPNRDAILDEAVAEYFRVHWKHWLSTYGASAFQLDDAPHDSVAPPTLRVYVEDDAVASGRASPLPDSIEIPVAGEAAPVRFMIARERSIPRQLQLLARQRIAGGTPGAGDVLRSAGSGTFGGWAWDATDDTLVLLSCQHVLGAEGQDVFVNGARGRQRVGRVKRAIGYREDDPMPLDCAIAAIESRVPDLIVSDLGPAILAIDDAIKDDLVAKRAAATRLKRGRVMRLWSGTLDGQRYHRVHRITARVDASWSRHSDSGALVFDDDDRVGAGVRAVVGLHFAGDVDNDGIGYALPIRPVFDALQITTISSGLLSLLVARNEEAMQTLGEVYLTASDTAALTRALLHVVESIDVIMALVHEVSVRDAAANLLRTVLASGTSYDQVADHVIAGTDHDALVLLANVLEQAGSTRACDRVRQLAVACDAERGRRIGDALGLTPDPLTPSPLS